jgi:hypothetical protein
MGIKEENPIFSVKPIDLTTLSLTPEEAFLLSFVDGKRSFREILLAVPFPEEKTEKMVEHLLKEGILIKGSSPPISPKRSLRQPPPMGKEKKKEEEEEQRKEIELLRKRVEVQKRLHKERDPFQVIGIRPGTPDDEVKTRFMDLRRIFHPDRYYHLSLPQELKSDLEEIYNDLQIFYEQVATEEKRKETYLKLKGLKKEEEIPVPVLNERTAREMIESALELGHYDTARKTTYLLEKVGSPSSAETLRKQIDQISKIDTLLHRFLKKEEMDPNEASRLHEGILTLEENFPYPIPFLRRVVEFLFLTTEDFPAMKRFAQILLNKKKDPETLLLVARVMMKGGEYDQALSLAKKVVTPPELVKKARELIEEIEKCL